MKIKILSIVVLLSLIFFSCNKEDMSALSDLIHIRNNGADMPAHIYGNGSDKVFIVVLHGGPGGSGLEYRAGKYAEMLEKHFAMVYWDQRGQGMSQGKYSEDKLTIEQLTDDLLKLILVLNEKYGSDIKVFLLGHSWGGMLGTSFMITGENQKHVAGWIEASGAHDISMLNKESVKMYQRISAEQLSLGNSSDKWHEIQDWVSGIDTLNITEEQSSKINSYGFEAEQALLNDGILQEGESVSFTQMIFSPLNPLTSYLSGNAANNSLNDQVESTNYTDQLYKIEKPCLFLWGKYDFVVPAKLGETAMQKISSTQKEIVFFEKSGHSPMDNEAEKFANSIIDFINKIK